MNDLDGPKVTRDVYGSILKARGQTLSLDYNAIPYALDAAIQRLRDEGLPSSRWATYVHMGI
jgi:hypothetical protein